MKPLPRNAFALVLLGACVTADPPAQYGDPSAPPAESEEAGIVASVLAPTGTRVDASSVELVLRAYVRSAPTPLTVSVSSPDAPTALATPEGAPGPMQRFRATVRLAHGSNPLTIRVATADESRIRYLGLALRYAGAAPGLRARVTASEGSGDPCADARAEAVAVTRSTRACVRGVVTLDTGRALRSLRVGDVSVTPDAQGRFARAVDLAMDRTQRIALRAEDAIGSPTAYELEVTQDATGPTVRLDGVEEGAAVRVEAERYTLRGRAEDPTGLSSLRVEYEGGGVVALDPASPFTTTLNLDPGPNPLTLVAFDGAGNERRVRFTLARDRDFILRPPPAAGASAQLDLDRFAIERLFSENDQRATDLIEVPLRPALVNALRAIREPFTRGVDTSRWRAAEWNLYRLLNMTPDTANLRGSSLDPLLQISNAVGLPSARVLAQLIDATVVTPFVDLDTVADVLLDQLVGTHPNAQRNARGEIVLRLSLYDVLNDLRPLAARFGPAGTHPGFLAPGTSARTLESGFSMSIPVRSSLRAFEGVDLTTASKRYLYLGAGGALLDLDFTSDRFAVVGIVDQPAVDLGFTIQESPAFARVGTSRTAGPDAMRPGFYRGDGAAFALSPWLIERIVAETAYRQYAQRFASTAYARTLRYDAGAIRDATVIDWSRGWVTIRTSGGIGSPPAPSYLWDALSEVAQIRLHDGGVAEGMANLAFTIPRVPIGLTADELVRTLRPTLMAQRAALSQRLVGSQVLASSAVDFYYVPSTDPAAAGFLFFRSPADGAGPTYATPGFFEDMALSRRASVTTALPGTADTTHEKVAATPGRALYLRDDGGAVFRVTVMERTADGVRVRVARPS